MNEEIKAIFEEIRQECHQNSEQIGLLGIKHTEERSKLLKRISELERKYNYIYEKVREKPDSFYDRISRREERIRKIKEKLILFVPNLSFVLFFTLGVVIVWVLLHRL